MDYGFDAVDLEALRRRRSMKWRGFDPDVLPAWVAEMDFDVAPPVAAAIVEAVARGGDFGYAVDLVAPELSTAFAGFAKRRWDWDVDADRVVLLRDVMRGIELWIEGCTEPGDAVVVCSPVYYPFLEAISRRRRTLVEVPMVRGDARWELDLDGLRAAFAAGAKLFLLCNPHNPIGRVYGREELDAIAELTIRHDLRVVSDEVHAPLVLDGTHVPFASLHPDVAARTLTLSSASKAFNLAGLHAAVAVAGNPEEDAWLRSLPYRFRGAAGILGVDASAAAFAEGDAWLDALLVHLRLVRDHVAAELGATLPGAHWFPPEGTYLGWIDARNLGLGENPRDAFLERGRVAFNDGAHFGRTGAGFVRLNFGTSRAIATQIVERMAATLDS
ncbi:MAG: MalY/PatB family protein [Sporichthyaceae bacterium]